MSLDKSQLNSAFTDEETHAVPSRKRFGRTFEGEQTKGEDAFVLIWVIMMMTVLLGFAGLSVDLGNWYLQVQRAQRAGDAAALAGDPFMPGNYSAAQTAAKLQMKENAPDIYAKFIACGASCMLPVSGHPTQFRVVVKTSATNNFLKFFGLGKTQNFSRVATADHTPSLHLSTGRNFYGGYQPHHDNGQLWSEGDFVPVSGAQVGKYWLSILGPHSDKVNGDRFSTQNCNTVSSPDGNGNPAVVTGCSAGPATSATNNEYDPANTNDQYNYHIHVNAGGGASKYLMIQAYDPGYAADDGCSAAMPYGGAEDVCPQDHDSSGASGDPSIGPTTTQFKLFKSVGGAAVGTCKTYAGTNSPISAYGSTSFKWIHNWETVCDTVHINTNIANDYVLRVSTTAGAGTNSYLLRAALVNSAKPAGWPASVNGDDSLSTPNDINYTASKALVTMSSDRNLGIFDQVPLDPPTPVQFGLAQISADMAGQTMTLQMFDVGDNGGSQATGTVQLVDDYGQVKGPCHYTKTGPGARDEELPLCSVAFNSGDFNGQLASLGWHIPPSWTCLPLGNLRSDGCWMNVRITFDQSNAGADPFDFTTWSIAQPGAPLRLIKTQ